VPFRVVVTYEGVPLRNWCHPFHAAGAGRWGRTASGHNDRVGRPLKRKGMGDLSRGRVGPLYHPPAREDREGWSREKGGTYSGASPGVSYTLSCGAFFHAPKGGNR